TGGGRPTEVLSVPFDPLPGVLPPDAPHGARAPLQRQAAAWVETARSLLVAGSVMVFDYAVEHTAELVARPWRDWLRTYRGHTRGTHYLSDPGSQDITADVCIDQLPPPDRCETQAAWLRRFGIDDLVEQGRVAWHANAARP